jgi:DNA invertase Pin-like site-specific DNA recombinase
LLELACLTRPLIVDESTVYDPRDPNDRLVLGMKGTMADFELVWLRQRMDGGRWCMARKGELRHRVTLGYIYDGNHLVFDPDEEVRRAVALLFERYAQATTCRELARDFSAQPGLHVVPKRSCRRQGRSRSVAPGPPTRSTGGGRSAL